MASKPLIEDERKFWLGDSAPIIDDLYLNTNLTHQPSANQYAGWPESASARSQPGC